MSPAEMSTIQKILTQRIVAIVRLDDYDRAVQIANALAAGGITILEFTLTGRGAMDAVANVRKELGDHVVAGVGSVLRAEDASAAIETGAQFVVTPALRKQVIAACVNRKIPVLAGGFTPTELLDAHEAGCELVKLFPAQLGGPRYLKDVLAPMPFLRLVPTGGISTENAREYLAAGAAALGIGGNLISKQTVAEGAFDQITAAAQALAAVVGPAPV